MPWTRVHSGQQGYAAGGANGFGGVGISEANGLGEKTVEIGRLYPWVAHGSEGVVTLIVGQQKDDVWFGPLLIF